MLICSLGPFLMLRLFLSNVGILYITGKLVRCQSVENLRHGIAHCMLENFSYFLASSADFFSK